jgi:hypothetical protein
VPFHAEVHPAGRAQLATVRVARHGVDGAVTVRALIAARKSNKVRETDGSQRHGISLDDQDTYSQEFIARMGWTVAGVARDTITGRTAPVDRKDLGKWLTDPEKLSRYDCIVAYKSDRYSRGEDTDWSRIETWAADNGKILVMVDSATGVRFPARDDSDYWQWAAMKRQAGQEWNAIRERSVRTQKSIRANGGFVGKPAWGYTTEGPRYSKRLVPTEQGREYIPQIFRMKIAGASLESIAAWLSVELWQGIPFKLPRWWAKTVGEMLRCTTYMGYVTSETGKVVYQCEALVDASTFALAGKALENTPKRGPVNVRNAALLKSALRCLHCEGIMYAIDCGSHKYNRVMDRATGKRTKKVLRDTPTPAQWYYRCAGSGPQRKGCGVMIRMDVADESALVMLRPKLDKPVIDRVLVPGKDWTAEIADVEYRLSHLGMQGLSEDDEDIARAELRAERKRLQGLPATEPTWNEIEMPFTYLSVWVSLPRHERGKWLAANEFYLWADSEGIAIARPDTWEIAA